MAAAVFTPAERAWLDASMVAAGQVTEPVRGLSGPASIVHG